MVKKKVTDLSNKRRSKEMTSKTQSLISRARYANHRYLSDLEWYFEEAFRGHQRTGRFGAGDLQEKKKIRREQYELEFAAIEESLKKNGFTKEYLRAFRTAYFIKK